MNHSIANKYWQIQVADQGAELQQLRDPLTGTEYLWQGDPAFWNRRSPVLFPIVGTLKADTYYYKGRAYQMGRHGFARDQLFQVETRQSDFLSLSLKSNADTLQVYPFPFQFFVEYRLQDAVLEVSYRVLNTGPTDCWFSVGGHPAFRLPIFEGEQYQDYLLEFDQPETLDRWPITADGLISEKSLPFLQEQSRISLNKSLFQQDAIVFKHPLSNRINLRHALTGNGLELDFNGFPYLGIWAAKNADFVCIEPWCGIADAWDSSQQLQRKEGINCLQPGAVFSRSWQVKRL